MYDSARFYVTFSYLLQCEQQDRKINGKMTDGSQLKIVIKAKYPFSLIILLCCYTLWCNKRLRL